MKGFNNYDNWKLDNPYDSRDELYEVSIKYYNTDEDVASDFEKAVEELAIQFGMRSSSND